MEFFDKLGKKATEAYKVTADKTGKIAKETKLKFKIGELKTQISNIYEEIGEKVYEKHVREEEISIKKDLEEECTKIDVLSDEIESLLKQCLELKDKRQCEKCYKEIDKDDKFCPNCGAKQSNEPPKEVEVIETLKNTEVKKENKKEKQIVMDNLEQEVTDKKKKQKTNKKEAEEDTSKKKENKKEEKTNLEKTVKVESNVDLKEEENKDD